MSKQVQRRLLERLSTKTLRAIAEDLGATVEGREHVRVRRNNTWVVCDDEAGLRAVLREHITDNWPS